MPYQFDWIDAFTDRAFGGNGCAVVHDGAGLPDVFCMDFVKETSLVECTFTGPSDVADINVRYFLASGEIPFAGHPTIATAVALRQRNIIGDGACTFETKAGIIGVHIKGTRVSMQQVTPEFGAYVDPQMVADVAGLLASDVVGAPRIVSTGLPFCITLLRDEAALARAVLSPRALQEFQNATGTMMEPFWAVLGGTPDAPSTRARLLMAPPSPAEDPFTGSATGALGAYLWSEGLIGVPDFIAYQGAGMGRPGRAEVQVLGPRDAMTGVCVTGDGALVMSGILHLP